ncbi:glycosyltransferase [Paraburkholderia bryophila]|uniref:Glycosyl transferase family 1 n=1 Tax=Paraburkholderia bryophila TaxID=420952 RepID=A0A329BP45_9BURK|nr:glycosyltransferase [Paraburkholderia bryophila]RAS23141.1 glycosyl transferase family 1 [Paraburkholderia bryophila]
MQKPRILALLPFLVKGALSIIVLRSLRERGFDVTVAFCEDASEIYVADPLLDFAADGHLIDLTKVNRHLQFETLLQQIRNRDINLILQLGASDLYHNLPYWKEEIPSLRIVDTLYNEFGQTLNHFLYERCMDGVIVESDYMCKFVKQASLQAQPNVQIVHSGIDLTDFVPKTGANRCDKRLTVGYVGRMSVEKNPMGFVDLAERLFDSQPNVEFLLFGGGNQADAVRQRVEQSPAAARLSYKGFAKHTADALHELDILVVPSKFDGRPNVIMEANACGVPVIAAPVGGIPELIEEGRNGFLIGPTETDRVAHLLAGLLDEPSKLGVLKQASREIALSKFDRAHMFDAYESTLIVFASA